MRETAHTRRRLVTLSVAMDSAPRDGAHEAASSDALASARDALVSASIVSVQPRPFTHHANRWPFDTKAKEPVDPTIDTTYRTDIPTLRQKAAAESKARRAATASLLRPAPMKFTEEDLMDQEEKQAISRLKQHHIQQQSKRESLRRDVVSEIRAEIIARHGRTRQQKDALEVLQTRQNVHRAVAATHLELSRRLEPAAIRVELEHRRLELQELHASEPEPALLEPTNEIAEALAALDGLRAERAANWADQRDSLLAAIGPHTPRAEGADEEEGEEEEENDHGAVVGTAVHRAPGILAPRRSEGQRRRKKKQPPPLPDMPPPEDRPPSPMQTDGEQFVEWLELAAPEVDVGGEEDEGFAPPPSGASSHSHSPSVMRRDGSSTALASPAGSAGGSATPASAAALGPSSPGRFGSSRKSGALPAAPTPLSRAATGVPTSGGAAAAGAASPGSPPGTAAAGGADAKGTRYLDVEGMRGDISKLYPHNVDPAKAERGRKMGILAKATSHGSSASARPPFAEQWVKLGAPDRGSIFACVPPAVYDRLPMPDVTATPLVEAEISPHMLLPTGTDLDDEPAQRVQRALAVMCAAHLADGASWEAQAEMAAAEALPALGRSDDAKVAAKREELIERLITLSYSSHADDASQLLPVPIRGARSGAEFLYEKGAKAGSTFTKPGIAWMPRRDLAGEEDDDIEGFVAAEGYGLHRHSGIGVISHIGKAIAQHSDPSEARAAAAEQVAAAKAAAEAAARMAEEASKMAQKKMAAMNKGGDGDGDGPPPPPPGWEANAPGSAPKVKAVAIGPAERKRMQKVLDDLGAPMMEQVDFALKYSQPGREDALRAALPLWEAAAEAIHDFRAAKRKGNEEKLRLSRERCTAAAHEAWSQVDDVVRFQGRTFEDIIQE